MAIKLHIGVVGKVATYQKRDGVIVCGNEDYQAEFSFDESWDAYEKKTARFIWNGTFMDIDINGNTCFVPKLKNTTLVEVGVFAGEYATTTSASIPAVPSVLCKLATPSVENDEHYANEAKEAAERAAEDARAEVIRLVGEIGVVQTMGDSPTAVMSQSATTGCLVQHDARITKNDKRITNIERGLPEDVFLTDDAVAYVKDIPANALPYAEIQKVGGMTRKCANLIPLEDKEFTLQGVTFTCKNGTLSVHGVVSGEIASSNEMFKSNFKFALSAGTYTVKSTGASATVIIKKYSNGENLALFNKATDAKTFTLAEYTELFLSFYMYNQSFNNEDQQIMLNEGSTALHYEPYFDGLRSSSVTEVVSVGANLFNDIEWFETFNFTQQSDGSWLGRLLNTKCFTNTTRRSGAVYITFIAKTDSSDVPMDFLAYYTDGTSAFVGDLRKTNGFETKTIVTNPNKTVDYIVWTYGSGGSYYIKGISFSFANVGYTPYVERTIPIPDAVQACEGYGVGINESVYNYIDFEKKQFVKRVGVVDMSTLGWSMNVSGGFSAQIGDIATTRSPVLCSPYTWQSKDFSWGGFASFDDKSIFTAWNTNVFVKDTAYTDVATFKTAMQGVMLVYELEEPITDSSIADIIPADNFIGVEGGGTITFENENGYAVPSDVTYQLKGVTA